MDHDTPDRHDGSENPATPGEEVPARSGHELPSLIGDFPSDRPTDPFAADGPPDAPASETGAHPPPRPAPTTFEPAAAGADRDPTLPLPPVAAPSPGAAEPPAPATPWWQQTDTAAYGDTAAAPPPHAPPAPAKTPVSAVPPGSPITPASTTFATERRPLYEYPIYDQPAPAPITEPAKRRRWPMVALALFSGILGAAVLAGALWLGGVFDDPPPAETPTATGTTVIERITEIVNPDGGGDGTAIAVGRKVVPSIVTVEVGFNGGTEFQAFASGSGVVLSSDGQIITNDHVIEDAEDIRVVFQDGRIYDAELIGTDALTDLAVLQIEASNLIPIDIGSTGSLQIGETTIAIGNPLGLDGGASLTVGVLSAFNRQVNLSADQTLFGMLQTDAPITQGSSGGALVDAEGRLIGITTAIGVSAAGAEGIGFATPVELVTRITDEIIETGQVRHAFLGVNGESYIEEGDDGVMRPAGALLAGFVGDVSAAEDAGLEVGDRIVAVDGQEVRTMQDLINSLRLYRVGEVIEFEVVRDGTRLSAEVTLGERPSDL